MRLKIGGRQGKAARSAVRSSTPRALGSRTCCTRHGANSVNRVRLVKGSHIITRKFWKGEQAYLLQNADKRVIFVNPYEGDLALIGTTDIPFSGTRRGCSDRCRGDRLSARRHEPIFLKAARPAPT